MLSELSIDLHSILPRPSLYQRYHIPQIKFFEKKGIKTDLFAIEKYVDEVLEEVTANKPTFMKELGKPNG
jgi:protein involved in ribonucleotide reduction